MSVVVIVVVVVVVVVVAVDIDVVVVAVVAIDIDVVVVTVVAIDIDVVVVAVAAIAIDVVVIDTLHKASCVGCVTGVIPELDVTSATAETDSTGSTRSAGICSWSLLSDGIDDGGLAPSVKTSDGCLLCGDWSSIAADLGRLSNGAAKLNGNRVDMPIHWPNLILVQYRGRGMGRGASDTSRCHDNNNNTHVRGTTMHDR